jgi:copper chaperone CopZ
MTCQSCVSAVTKALQTVPGVEDYDINLEKKQVVVTGRGQQPQLESGNYGVVRRANLKGQIW